MSDHSPVPNVKSEFGFRAPDRVFLSATSGDLGSVREIVRQELRKVDCASIEQTEFPKDCSAAAKMLEEQIRACDAVIHLVGWRYGGEPDPSTLVAGAERRSYAQMHADIARALGVRLCVFLCAEEFPFDICDPEPGGNARLQCLYREEISAGATEVVRVSNPGDVAQRVRDLRMDLEKKTPAGASGHERRRLAIACGMALVFACGLIAVAWKSVQLSSAVIPQATAAIRSVTDAAQHVTAVMAQPPAVIPQAIKEAPAFDPVRIRANLLKHIRERAAQEIGKYDLKEVGDWEKVVELGKTRDQQITASDFLIEHIGFLFEKKEADADFATATQLLGEKGLTEALEFLNAGNDVREEKIEALEDAGEMQALREALDEKLLKAALLEKDMQFEKAQAEYRGAVAAGGAWAEPRNQLAEFLIQAATTADHLDGGRMLHDAVEVCRETLKGVTREQSPQDWAITQRNLGLALAQQYIRMRGKLGERFLADAITAFRAAVEVRPPGQSPQNWVRSEDGLSAALRQKAQGTSNEAERRQLYQEALKGYETALEVCPRQQSPRDWARMKFSLGTALADLGAQCSGEEARRLLAAAAASFRAALEVQKPEQLPLPWERTKNGLAGVLLEEGIRADGEESRRLLDEAVAIFRETLDVCAREQLLQDWARCQNGLGDALKEQGKRAGREQGRWFLAESAASYRAALEVYTPERLPMEWASTQYLLGDTLALQGKSTSGEDSRRMLEKAVAAYRAALEVKTRERFPVEWAALQNKLGDALVELGVRGGDEEARQMLTEAVRGFRASLEIFPPAYTNDRATSQKGLSKALKELSKYVDGAEAEQLQAEAKMVDAELGAE